MGTNSVSEIIKAVNRFLRVKRRRTVREDEVIFVMDEDVSYGQTWHVHRSKLMTSEQFGLKMIELLARGPSWIHANFIPTNAQKSLITIRAGASVGNNFPPINVSLEIDKVIDIIDD